MRLCVDSKTLVGQPCGKCGRSMATMHRHLIKGLLCPGCCGCGTLTQSNGIVAAAVEKVAGAISRFVDAGPRKDPWLTDNRRKDAGRADSWIPRRDWFNGSDQPRRVSASLMAPDGSIRPLPAPDYEPRPFDPSEGR